MGKDLFSTQAYFYDLPTELIAQQPTERRDRSRLLVVDRKTENFEEIPFCELIDFLKEGDSLVFNNTRVIPARLLGKREGGGTSEIFLLKCLEEGIWEALAKPGKKLKNGSLIVFGEDFQCRIIETKPNGTKIVKFTWEGNFEQKLEQFGQVPLPHYIHRAEQAPQDKERYQTVFASQPGAVAAPTAGLHFTKEMLQKMEENGIKQNTITLHVGLGTFRPVKTEDIRQHHMHAEPFQISFETALQLNDRKEGQRQICVGTTSVRALESAADENGVILPGQYETSIFIYPGYRFKYVQSLLTNFHLPESTLLMLVSAFAGYELTMEAYKKAVKDKFRFFSYGDAMLIL